MVTEALQNYTADILLPIADGESEGVKDRGGNWSPEYGLWVDQQIPDILQGMSESERRVVERFVPVALSVARLFSAQLQDGDSGIMWPREAYDEQGALRLINASLLNPAVNDPYSVIENGFHNAPTPYSRKYQPEISELRQLLARMLEVDSPSSAALRPFITDLMKAYQYDGLRASDLPFFRRAEESWVNIPPDNHLLVFAQPMEVYYDPLRMRWSGNEDVNEWAKRVTEQNELSPWRTFFEARLLVLDEAMISPAEVEVVRTSSRELFGNPSIVVPASTEFRRVLISAGNGSHPHKTAKNYPNFIGIREQLGYKNIHYTNMVRLGTTEMIKPWLIYAFGSDVLGNTADESLIRGRALTIVGHEENHPFRRFDGDQELEELKATVDGLWVLTVSGKFSQQDLQTAFMTEIGSMLYAKAEIDQMRAKGDVAGAGSRATYHIGDTILMNLLVQKGVFPDSRTINLNAMQHAIGDIVEDLNRYHQDKTGLLADRSLRDEAVWSNFRVKEIVE